MVELLRFCLIGICAALIFWGLVKVERIYQYPFFMASIFIAFILPQVGPLIETTDFLSQAAFVRVLVMACLCVSMCWVGYRAQPKLQWLQQLNIPLNDQKLIHIALLFTVMGYVFGQLTRAATANWSGGGQLSGPGTIFIFFSQVIYIGFAIFLMQLLKKPSAVSTLGMLTAGFPIVQTVLAGRRQPTMTFLIIVGLSFWLVRRKLPPRWALIILVISGIYLIPLIGNLRYGFWHLVFSGDWQALQTASQVSFDKLQKGDVLELRNAAVVMDAVDVTWNYGFGTGFWDAVVFQFVPGQLVGYDVKQSLQFNWTPLPELFQNYGYSLHVGTTLTGIGDTFMQFSYFGCLMFAVVGYLFKHLWISSVYLRSTVSSLLMIGLISPAMVGVTHGMSRFCQEAVFQFGVVFLIARYARVRHSQCHLASKFPSSPLGPQFDEK